MGLFDRWRKKPRTDALRSATTVAEAEGDGGGVVPEGHRMDIFQPAPLAYVRRTPGGTVLADMGIGGDEPPEELAKLLGRVETLVAAGSGPVYVAHHEGSIRGLFAPANLQVEVAPGLVVWILHAGSLGDWIDDPTRLQELLCRLYRLGTHPATPVAQQVYLVDHYSPRARILLELLAGLEIGVRSPDQNGTTLVEVQRPEGIIITAFIGQPVESKNVDPYPQTVNEEKAHAESAGDHDRLRQIEERERAFLAKRIAVVGVDRNTEPLTRATLLRRLLIDVSATNTEAAWNALIEDLVHRDFPLLLMADPKTRKITTRVWPGYGRGFPAYPDVVSLKRAAADLEMASGSFAVALMTPRDLIAWAAESGWIVALNAYRDRSSPFYVILPPDAMAEVQKRRT